MPVVVVQQTSILEDTAAPTRIELETKATELGIKFDGRTTDNKLSEKINEVLKG
jgi:hypothetical protein